MAKKNSIIKTAAVSVISKTLSGSDCIVSLQEEQGRVHTIYLSQEESSKIDLGHKLKLTFERVESK
jgi:hypothetical protein